MISVYSASIHQCEDWERHKVKIQYGFSPSIMKFTIELPSGSNLTTVQEACDCLAMRYDILRTAINWIDGKLIQQVAEFDKGVCEILKISSVVDEVRLDKLLKERFLKLNPCHLFKCLVIDNRGKLLLIFAIHHMISDFLTLNVLRREFEAIFASLLSKEKPSLTPVPEQFGQYVERNLLADSKQQNESIHFWRNKLEDLSWKLDYNQLDSIRHPLLGFLLFRDVNRFTRADILRSQKGSTYTTRLDNKFMAKLRMLKDSYHLSSFVILISLLNIVGSMIFKSKTILIQSVFSNRQQIDNILGNFISTHLIFNRPDGEIAFKDFIFDCYQSCAVAHRYNIFNSEPLETLALTPNSFLILNFFSCNNHNFDLESLALPLKKQIDAQCPLYCIAVEYDDAMILKWEYHQKFYNQESIKLVESKFLSIANALLSNPELKLKACNT